MDRRRAAGVLLALAACVAYATAAPTASNHTSLDIYDGAPDGCYYNFQHYGEGDRIMTNEPCLNCTCHNRMLMCYLRVCPFTKPIGQDCTIEKRADQCCPIVTCPDVPVDLLTSTTTSPAEYGATGLGKLDKYGCSIHGKYFPEGSKVPPTPNKPCEHCYCIRNMTTCVMQECTLHVDGCTPIYHKDVCCPVRYSCDHPEDEMPLLDDLSTTVRPTPGFLLTTTTLSPVTQMSQDCLYENQVIRDGALIKTEKACDHCYCMKGDIVCVVQECGTPMENEGKNCTALAPREGVCCPDTYICEGDEPTTGTYETDYTTDIEKLTTLSPPRRSESEGSGYRKETDGVPDADSPPTETETEGSGYDQATAHPTILTEAPESHKVESSDGMLSSTTTKEPSSYETTESELQKDTESQYHLPSTTSAYTSQQIDESLSTKAQDEDIGSGEEDIITPYETASTSSAAPDVEDHGYTVSSEQNGVTSESTKVTDSEIDVKATTIKTDITKEQSVTTDDKVIDDTTRHSLGEDDDVETSTFDDEYKFTERDSLQTTNIPIVEESEKQTTESPEQDKKTLAPHRYETPTTSASGIEEDVATTEPQDTATESFDGTDPEFYDQHHMTVTSSTPLLEEIEKDTTDQEIIRDGSTPDLDKISTIASNIPTEEPTKKYSFMPDVKDETIATNLPTTVSTIEDDVKTTDDEQKTNYEDSSEPQQFIPTTIASVFGDGTESTLSIESITTSKSQESQEIDTSEVTDHQHTSTASIPLLEDITKGTTLLHDMTTTSKFDESPEAHVEHSPEPQQHSPTTSGPRYDDESKETTDTSVTGEKESSEPHEYDSTTNDAILDDETKISTPSEATSIKPQESQETNMEDSSEPQQYTTRSPIIDDENRETTTKLEDQEIKVKDVSDSQHHVTTTSASMIEDETKISTPIALDSDTNKETPLATNAPIFEIEDRKTTPSDDLTTSDAQEDQKQDIDHSSESNQNAPITSAPVFEDEITKIPSDALTTFKDQDDKKTHSESNEYDSTTNGLLFEDESKLTTPTDFITTSKIQDVQEPYKYIPTTLTYKEESEETTISGLEESSTLVPKFEDEINDKQNEMTTAEPDKGLNTIPSGSVEEETTEPPGVSKHTDKDELIPIESATGQGNKLYDVTESIVDTTDHTTLDTSTSSKDLLTQPTKPTVMEIIDSSTKTTDISELITAVPIDVTEEELSTSTHDRQPSTKLPATEHQESGTSTLPSNAGDDFEEPFTTSSYEYSPQTTSSQSSDESQTVTSSPSYSTVTVSTAADLEENEISNESRIPGEGDCLLNGVTYRNESTVPSTNKCQSGCRCSSSIIKCDPIICSPPPEYMDNCQTTYDSPNSCCPTYVCDHKTETMPPQSHSQMSGTETPVESPIKCTGDECILNKDTKEPSLCDSGNCLEQTESDTNLNNVPKQPAEDRKEDCIGSLCKSDSGECSQENGCQASPVKPCEGTECKDSSETIPPQEQKPCIGDSCDIPVIDCSTGKCDDENKLDIEKECTEKSCKRKEDSHLDQQPPTKCSGSECLLSETTSEFELTTVGALEVKTEKIEESSKPSSATEADLNVIDESEDRVTEAVNLIESESTTGLPTESHKVPEQDSNKDEESTSYKPITPSTHGETSVPDSTQTNDMIDNESPNIYSTDKVEYDVTSEASEKYTETPDLSVDDKSTVYVPAEITTASPKTQTVEQDEFTKILTESEDVTTPSSQDRQTTQPPEHVREDITTSVSEEITTKISIIQEVDNGAMSTEQPVSTDSIPYDTTKLSVDTNEEETVTYDDSDNVTKLPQVSEEVTTKASEETTSSTYDSQDTKFIEDSTTQNADIEMSKPHSTDLQETTEIPKPSQNEETSMKTTDDFVTQTEISITTAPSRETITESSQSVDLEKTQDEQSPDTTSSEMTTVTIIEDVKTESPKPSEADTPEVSSDEEYTKQTTYGTDKEIDTQTIKPYETDSQEATLSSEKTETAEITKIPTVTEPSFITETEEEIVTKSPVSGEFTEIDDTAPITETEPSKGDERLHITVAPQQDGETDIDKIEDTVTESSEPSKPEIVSTTKSSLADPETLETTTKVAIGTDMESTQSDELEPQAVTQSAESVSVPFSDRTTIQFSEDDQKLYSESNLQGSTTLQPEIVSELTTQSTLVPDSKITETEKPDDNEIITRIQEPVTESVTESIEEITSTLSESSVKEDDMTSISNVEITTEHSLDITTMHVPHSEVTALSEKPDKLDEITSSEIHLSTSPETVTEHPVEKESETTTDIKKTTLTVMDLAEDAKTQVPDIVDTETVSTTEQTTYNIEKTPEQTDTLDSHEEQPAEPSRNTTESTVLETKLPVDSEIGQTDKPLTHEDESKSETPLTNEMTTVMFEEKNTENPIDKVEKQETTQYHEIMPTESGEEMYTKMPLPVSSEKEDHIIDEELTTDIINSSEEATESIYVFTNAPTDSFSTQNVDTEISHKEPLDTEVTQQAETPTDIENLQVKETQTTVADLPSEQESSTKEQLTSDTVKLTTELPKHSYTESLNENATTAKPFYTETVTELVEVTKEVEETTPEEELKPSPSATTASEEQMTGAQDHEDGENVATEKAITTESAIVETTIAPESIETSTKLTDMNTKPLEEAVDTSTPKHELLESTTFGKVEDEIVNVDKETTETSTIVSDEQTIAPVTDLEPVVIDVTTKKQDAEEDFISSETERTEKYPTTLFASKETAKTTPLPIEEAATEYVPISESNVSEEDKLTTVVAFNVETTSTPKSSELEVQTEKVFTPTESPIQLETSPVTTSPEKQTTTQEEEKQTTAKAEELTTAHPVFDKFTKTTHKPTDAPATEQPKPISTEEPSTDDILPPDEEPSAPGYGTDPDYMEEDQTFGPGTCRYGGKVYVSAQQIPRDDPCDFCFCFRSDIICLQQSCPPPIHGCHEEPISGFCCPRYECPVSMATTVNVTTTTTTTTTTLPPHFPVHSYKGSAQKRGCLIKGHTYKVGEVVRASSGPCLHCTCGGDGQMKCDPKQCTPEPMLRQMIAAAVSAKRRR